MNLRKELAAEIKAERYDLAEGGLYFPRQGVVASGEYFDRVNRKGPWTRQPNRIVTEGLALMLNVALGSVASEIVSLTEGYTAATRPVWTPVTTTTGSIDNMAAVASLTMATATQLNVTGAAILTNSSRGGTTGALISASKYAAARVFQDGDVYELGYRINLTV